MDDTFEKGLPARLLAFLLRIIKRHFYVVRREVTISAAQREQQDEMSQMRIHFIPEKRSSEWQAELPLQKLR